MYVCMYVCMYVYAGVYTGDSRNLKAVQPQVPPSGGAEKSTQIYNYTQP